MSTKTKTPKLPNLPPSPQTASDPLTPSIQLLIKLGSAVVHAEELLEQPEIQEFFAKTPLSAASQFDRTAILSLLGDEELKTWRAAMDKQAFLPVKRH